MRVPVTTIIEIGVGDRCSLENPVGAVSVPSCNEWRTSSQQLARGFGRAASSTSPMEQNAEWPSGHSRISSWKTPQPCAMILSPRRSQRAHVRSGGCPGRAHRAEFFDHHLGNDRRHTADSTIATDAACEKIGSGHGDQIIPKRSGRAAYAV